MCVVVSGITRSSSVVDGNGFSKGHKEVLSLG